MDRVRFVVVVFCLCLLAGCSSRSKGKAPGGQLVLQEVNDLLHAASGATGRPAAALTDLNQYQGMFPRGYAAVQSGAVTVFWGTPLKGEGEVGKDEVVVAFQKGVPTEGGFVLLSAGTVKKMTAAEFGTAPKGGAR
jgi:hypothetical protein